MVNFLMSRIFEIYIFYASHVIWVGNSTILSFQDVGICIEKKIKEHSLQNEIDFNFNLLW